MHRRPPGQRSRWSLHAAGDLIDRELIQADFKPLPGSKIGEFTAHFDIILGRTPDEATWQRNRTAIRRA